jgi:hypothetical protein
MIKKTLIGSAICLSIVGCKEKQYITTEKLDKIEIVNTCEDLLEYFWQDLENGRIDSVAFKSYTWNIEDVLERYNRLNCENCDEID